MALGGAGAGLEGTAISVEDAVEGGAEACPIGFVELVGGDAAVSDLGDVDAAAVGVAEIFSL